MFFAMYDKEWMVHEWKAVTRRSEWGYKITGTHCSLQCVQSIVKVFSFLWCLVPFRSRAVLELGLYLESNWLV